MTNNKVFITGLGAITGTGQTTETIWQQLTSGETAIAPIKNWDIETLPIHIGCEVANVSPKMLPDKKVSKVISRQDILGINAATQAMQHSGLADYIKQFSAEDPKLINLQDRTGLYVGSPGNKYFQQHDFLNLIAKSKDDMGKFAADLFSEVHPMWLLRSLPNNVLAYIGITYGLKGANHNITNHAVSGTQALIEAYHAIQSGQIDRACVVGYDIGPEPQALYYYDKLGLLSNRDLKPFAHDGDGTVLAEGAAAIILESANSVHCRNGTPYAEFIGGAATTESQGLFAISETGDELANLLDTTISKYALNHSKCDFIIAHGNGNPKSDRTEAKAISKIFSSTPPVSAFKWSVGHTLCASGILDTCLASIAIKNKYLPGIANLATPHQHCSQINISSDNRNLDNCDNYAVVINRGFAAMNACTIIKAC